jgi:GntR family transcriptional repressor for pyruvate dehydrogenase complex
MHQDVTVVSRETLTDRVVEGILALITDQDLREGDSLPPTRELATRFDVSVVVVREAVAVLAGRGLLVRRQGREPVLALPGHELLTAMLSFRERQEALSHDDILQCRATLEVQSAVLASSKASREYRQASLEKYVHLLLASRDIQAFNDSDLLFHSAVARLSGNRALILIQASLYASIREDLFERSTTQLRKVPFADWLSVMVLDHQTIADAIIRGDRAAAADAMLTHFEKARPGIDFGRA